MEGTREGVREEDVARWGRWKEGGMKGTEGDAGGKKLGRGA